MAFKCDKQYFKIHKCLYSKDGFKKYGAWAGFKNKAGEWHDVYMSLMFMGEKASIELTPQSRIKVTGGLSHDKNEKDGKVYESWNVFVDEVEIVQMGGEQGGTRQPMATLDDVPFAWLIAAGVSALGCINYVC